MRRSSKTHGVSPAISTTLLLAIVVAGFAMVSVSSFEFFRSMTDKTADAELEFKEEGDNEIVVTFLENENVDYVDIVMANGDVHKFNNEGESKKITIEQAGDIKAVGGFSESGRRQLIRRYSPHNIRAIEGTVSYNPPAEGVTVKIERSGRVIVTQETNENGEFGLVPSSDGSYDIQVEDIENAESLVQPGTKNIDIVLDQNFMTDEQSSYGTLAELLMEGSGTRDDPYIIQNPSDLQATRTDKGAHYVIKEDIDASVTQSSSWGSGFDHIGTEIDKFNGTVKAPNPVRIEGIRMNNSDKAIFEDLSGVASIDDNSIDAVSPNGSKVDVVPNGNTFEQNFPSRVVEGKKIRGNVTVLDSGEVKVEVPGVDKKTKTVDLGSQAEKTVDFKLETNKKDRGSYNINVSTKDSSKKAPVDIVLPERSDEPVVASFDVPDVISSDKSSFKVRSEILNAGDSKFNNKSVTIDPGGIEANSVEKNLNDLEPNESQVVTETFQIQSTDELKEYQMSIIGENIQARDSYEIVTTPAGFNIDTTKILDNYVEGDDVTVRSKITNTANSESSSGVTFQISDLSISKSVKLHLDPGESENVSLGVNTNLGDTGRFSYNYKTSSDSVTDSLNVESVDTNGITTSIDSPSTKQNYTIGNSIDPIVAVRNDGSSSTQPELAINLINDTEGVIYSDSPSTSELSPGSINTYSRSFGTSNLEPGSYRLVSKTQTDRDELPVNVVSDNGVQVRNINILNPRNEIKRGGTLRLNAEVENTGVGSPSKTLSVKTSNSKSSKSVKYAIRSATTKTLRVALPISQSQPTGTTDILVSTDTTKRETVTIVD